MKCEKCGMVCKDTQKFCLNCGNPLHPEEPEDIQEQLANSVGELLDGFDDDDDDADVCTGCCGSCGDEQEYEVTCPKCGETITVYEEDLDFGSIRCPKCDAELEFDMSPDDKDK